MNNYMKTIISGLQSYIHSYTKKARGNWNQNNPDAIDYIKNRPFYSETKNVVLFERSSITNFDFENENIVGIRGNGNINFLPNIEYSINCNGNNYTCKLQSIESQINGFGDFGLIEGVITNNNFPFAFVQNAEYNLWVLAFVRADVETYSFKITGFKETIVKVPEKYLPPSKNSNILNGTGKGAVKTKYASQASGDYSFAEGYNTEASGDYSHTEGDRTEASGLCSHAEGDSTTASGEKSHAEGGNTQSDGWTSHAEGNWTIASGSGSHAEGSSTTASGQNSHAEGSSTIASGEVSHAEGYNTTASGKYSHTEGYYSKASGNYAHAEGDSTEASGLRSHAEGDSTKANGSYSHAEGLNTIASGTSQHVQGKYNIEDSENRFAHIVGNGTYNTRSNIHTLDWDGNAWFAGNIYIGGSGQETGMPLLSMTEITLFSNGWVNNQQEVIINGVSANEIDQYIQIIPVQLNQSNIEIITKCNIKAIGQKKDSIIFKCDKLPNSNVRFYIVIANIIWQGARPNLGVLTDFEYIKNADGTYTLTSWKGTLNGIPSNKMHIPNSSEIIF